MANKEIISSLRGLIGKYNLTDEEWQTVEKTIKLLNNSDSDCISCKNTLEAMIKQLGIRSEDYLILPEATLYKVVKNMPPVTPQPKTMQEKQADNEKYQKAYDDGYDDGYAQARFDFESKTDVLDKIKAKIQEVYNDRPDTYNHLQRTELFCKVMKIIDKYTAEKE